MRVHVGMPQMAVKGLSENWLFKHCGDSHWSELSRIFGARSQDFISDSGARIYSSFVAIRGRYAVPLSEIQENTEIDFSVVMDHFGMSILRSRHTGHIDGEPVINMEMLTKFVAREREGSNDLVRASMRPVPVHPIDDMGQPPELVRDFQKVRAGKANEITVPGCATGKPIPTIDPGVYEPNPYTDYNGAGLLYFASYPAISDHMERKAVKLRLDTDWSLHSGTVQRDIFYFGNLDLGKHIEMKVVGAEFLGAEQEFARLDTSMMEAGTDRLLARICTIKALGDGKARDDG
ncbi:MAG: hypothetical protein P1U65_03975 [Minwuia sp.]|nr:hypothetical protein [Minwuia sp.]